MLEHFLKEKRMEKVDLNGKMGVIMKEILWMDCSLDMVIATFSLNTFIGKYYFADLDKIYEGEFRMGNMEGKGIEAWNDGRKYDGDFKNGKKDGEGTFEWPNGNKYIGSWKADKQHGLAIYYNSKDGSKK